MEQRELLAEAKRLLETGELFPRGTAEEPYAPDAEAEATDSEPEVHVMEPLADDHSSDDGEDAPTGVEESAARAAPAVAARVCLRGCKQSVSYTAASHQRDSTLPLCRAQRKNLWCTIRDREPGYQLSVTSARVHVRVNRVDVDTCWFSKSCRLLLLPCPSFCLLYPCVFTFFASSIACALNGVK